VRVASDGITPRSADAAAAPLDPVAALMFRYLAGLIAVLADGDHTRVEPDEFTMA
jgi:hypothetical protein